MAVPNAPELKRTIIDAENHVEMLLNETLAMGYSTRILNRGLSMIKRAKKEWSCENYEAAYRWLIKSLDGFLDY